MADKRKRRSGAKNCCLCTLNAHRKSKLANNAKAKKFNSDGLSLL